MFDVLKTDTYYIYFFIGNKTEEIPSFLEEPNELNDRGKIAKALRVLHINQGQFQSLQNYRRYDKVSKKTKFRS